MRTKEEHSAATSVKDTQPEHKPGKEYVDGEMQDNRATEDEEGDAGPSGNDDLPPQYIDAVQKLANEKPAIEAPSVPASDLGEPFGTSLSTAKRHASDDLGLVMTASGLSQAKYDSDGGALQIVNDTDRDPNSNTVVAGSGKTIQLAPWPELQTKSRMMPNGLRIPRRRLPQLCGPQKLKQDQLQWGQTCTAPVFSSRLSKNLGILSKTKMIRIPSTIRQAGLLAARRV